MLPEAARQGLQGFEEEDVAGLADRLRAEVLDLDGCLLVWPVVVGRATVPGY